MPRLNEKPGLVAQATGLWRGMLFDVDVHCHDDADHAGDEKYESTAGATSHDR